MYEYYMYLPHMYAMLCVSGVEACLAGEDPW